MSSTVNYGFNIYTDNEVENLQTVRQWRKKLDGTDSDSNMVKIDAAIKQVEDSIPNVQSITSTEINALFTTEESET